MKETEWYQDRMYEMRRELAQEQERLTDKAKQLDERVQLFDALDELLAENRKQQADIESLQQQLVEEKRQRAELEMKLKETRKFSDDVAKKTSEEGVIKALSTYVNRSKRKTADKRAYIKNMILEIVSVNGLSLPDELSSTIECLDDEQTEPKVVNVAGNYNDIHDNGEVKVKS